MLDAILNPANGHSSKGCLVDAAALQTLNYDWDTLLGSEGNKAGGHATR